MSFPMSVNVEYSIQRRDSSGQWVSYGKKVNTRDTNSKEHDFSKARTNIEEKARELFAKESYVRIICDYWDSAGWGEGYFKVVWENGRWID